MAPIDTTSWDSFGAYEIKGSTIQARIFELDGRYVAEVLMEPDMPHHGEGTTPDEAVYALYEALMVSWRALCNAPRRSIQMERRKARLDSFFSPSWAAVEISPPAQLDHYSTTVDLPDLASIVA